jgi:hypothetical protein
LHAPRKSKEKLGKGVEGRAEDRMLRDGEPLHPVSEAHTALEIAQAQDLGRVTQCHIAHCFTGEYFSPFFPS